mgnify:CR=1 FL=1
MRHLKAGKKLNRSPSHRIALMRNLVTSLLRHEKIQTTDAKAKEVRRWADRMISLGKRGGLHARRQTLQVLQDKAVVRKVFDSLAPRFKNRAGGYTRTVKIGWRRGDHAPLSVVELVPGESQAGGEQGARGRRRRSAAPKKEPASAKKDSPARKS